MCKASPWSAPMGGEAREDSDIDLVILTDRPQRYLDEVQWPKRFGVIEKLQNEDYGKLMSLRIWYQNGREVEYGITMAGSPIFDTAEIALF